MKKLLLLITLALAGCMQPGNPVVVTPSPVATVGQDLSQAATKALQGYAEYKGGGANMTWALAEGLWAYQTTVHTAADVKALVTAWTGSKGAPLAQRLSILFGTSNGTAAQKMAALANAATTAATTANAKTAP